MPSTFNDNLTLNSTTGLTTSGTLNIPTFVTFHETAGFVLLPSLGFVFDVHSAFVLDSSGNTYNRSLLTTLVFNELASRVMVFKRSPNNTITFTGVAKANHVFNKTANNTLTLTEDAEHLKIGIASNTIAFSQYINVSGRIRNQSASNQLIFNQSATRNVVFVRSANNQLVFNQFYKKYTGLGDVFIYIPQADYIVVPRVCKILLEVPSRAIVLPCPQFDDTQEWSSLVVNLKRSIIGDTRTYVRRSGLTKLKYVFWLGRKKSLELRQFILDFTSQEVQLTNFKGEVWLGHILNNPSELIPKSLYEPERERVDFTLEYEGIKIRG